MSSSRTAAVLQSGNAVSAVNDPRLGRLIESGGSEEEIERLLAEVAAPVIRRIVARHYRTGGDAAYEAGDLESSINIRLLHKLRRIPSSPAEAIQDLDGYIATLSFNVVHDHLRRRFPERTRLKNRIRYTLTHDARLALWSTPAGFAAGLSRWNGSRITSPVSLDPAQVTRAMLDRDHPARALHALLDAAGAPVELEALVDHAAVLWGVTDRAEVQLEELAGDPLHATIHLERRELLQALWREIGELRPMQRKALLLNLRDDESENVAALLVLAGIAGLDDVAAVLEMPPDALSKIWNDLPLDDLRIGELLGVTRQQVINLRKSARERLRRRLRFSAGR